MRGFQELEKLLEKVEKRLSAVEKQLKNLIRLHETTHIDFDSAILKLPKHLQETLIAVSRFQDYEAKEPTATDISKITHKARAVESGNLNQLTRLGYLIKSRRGRQTIFKIRDRQ